MHHGNQQSAVSAGVVDADVSGAVRIGGRQVASGAGGEVLADRLCAPVSNSGGVPFQSSLRSEDDPVPSGSCRLLLQHST